MSIVENPIKIQLIQNHFFSESLKANSVLFIFGLFFNRNTVTICEAVRRLKDKLAILSDLLNRY